MAQSQMAWDEWFHWTKKLRDTLHQLIDALKIPHPETLNEIARKIGILTPNLQKELAAITTAIVNEQIYLKEMFYKFSEEKKHEEELLDIEREEKLSKYFKIQEDHIRQAMDKEKLYSHFLILAKEVNAGHVPQHQIDDRLNAIINGTANKHANADDKKGVKIDNGIKLASHQIRARGLFHEQFKAENVKKIISAHKNELKEEKIAKHDKVEECKIGLSKRASLLEEDKKKDEAPTNRLGNH
jgi:hypothetical protein